MGGLLSSTTHILQGCITEEGLDVFVMSCGARRGAVAAAAATAVATTLLLHRHLMPSLNASGNEQLKALQADAGEPAAAEELTQQQQRQEAPGTRTEQCIDGAVLPKPQEEALGANGLLSACQGDPSGSLDQASGVHEEKERERQASSGALDHRYATLIPIQYTVHKQPYTPHTERTLLMVCFCSGARGQEAAA